jgi:hypothetical protein
MGRLIRYAIYAGLVALVTLTVAGPVLARDRDDRPRRDRDDYWRNYWGWYDGSYRPYYRRYPFRYWYYPYYGRRFGYGDPHYGYLYREPYFGYRFRTPYYDYRYDYRGPEFGFRYAPSRRRLWR